MGLRRIAVSTKIAVLYLSLSGALDTFCAVLCCAVCRALLCCQGPEKRAEYGIKDNLVRYSCGVEAMEDLWADIEQALDQI